MKKTAHALTAALLLAASVCTTATRAAESDTLRYGVEAQYPPFESKAASGELQGLDIDVGNAVCATAKMKCVWVETSFDGLIPALQGRKFDAINSAMNATDQRRQAIDFTTVVYRVPTQLIAKTGSGLEPTPASLKGKNIGVLQGSIQENFAKAHWANAGVNVVPYQDQNQAYTDLKAGRLDGTLVPLGRRSNGLPVQAGRRRVQLCRRPRQRRQDPRQRHSIWHPQGRCRAEAAPEHGDCEAQGGRNDCEVRKEVSWRHRRVSQIKLVRNRGYPKSMEAPPKA
jgi:lysine/arginine/ornithine transport system substrate-binding protein